MRSNHEPLDLVQQLGTLLRLETRRSTYTRDLADAVGDHSQRRILIEALALYQVRKLHRTQLGQLLVEVHMVDQVVDPIFYRQIRIHIGRGSQLFTSVVFSVSLAALSRLGQGVGQFTCQRRANPPIPFTNWRRRTM